MASIRKTKKRLKRQIAEEIALTAMTDNIYLADAIHQSVLMKIDQLVNLKRKKI